MPPRSLRILAGEVPTESYVDSELGLALSMRMDTLGWVMTLIVTASARSSCSTAAASRAGDATKGKAGASPASVFSAILLAFAGAMYGLVLTDDLIVLVMFWEITSILSYLLIGFYHARGASRRAALQALLVTTLGGLACSSAP
jgi:multicomponent Na+:H+ antiporter subunit A